MTIQTQAIEYDLDGTTFEGTLSWDDANAGPLPGVLIAHAWGGSGDFERGRAEALAELGYAGFAADIYGKGRRGASVEENSALMQPLLEDRALLQARMHVSLEAARAVDVVDGSRMAAIGYCFGGLCVLDLARTGADVSGVVSLHGLFVPPGNIKGTKITASVLALHGWEDPMVPPESVTALAAELTEAGADWQLHAYGHCLHAFTNPAANDRELGTVYDATADRRSWQAVSNFLAEVLE
ncbi:MAG TPA: dienelactone hydrolase family protein [Gammaproteobacteria bacterium]